MKILHNEKGVALITSLMFTVISLVMTMALLYMITASVRTSGAIKRYRTTTEAGYGGTDIMVKDLVSATFAFHNYSITHPGTQYKYYMENIHMANMNSPNVNACLRSKVLLPKSLWPVSCLDPSLIAKNGYDVSFNLRAASDINPASGYVVYSKIVDTMERKFQVYRNNSSINVRMAGNSDTSSTSLEGASTTDGSGVAVPHYPYIYRIEIQAERQQNPSEKSRITVQYAY